MQVKAISLVIFNENVLEEQSIFFSFSIAFDIYNELLISKLRN